MKKKVKNKWILVLAGVAGALALGGCAIRESKEDILTNNNLTAQVIYYANGGVFGKEDTSKVMYYSAGNSAMNVGVDKITSGVGSITLAKKDYDLIGWYYAVLDDEGNPTYTDETKTEYKLGEEVDFSKKLQAGDKWVLVADWAKQVMLNIQIVCPEGETIGMEGNDTTYQNGSIHPYSSFGQNVEISLDSQQPFDVKDKTHTFLEYYTDEACTQLLNPSKVEREETDSKIYAKYIKGNYTVVKTRNDAIKMLTNTSSSNKYYVFNDIDMENRSVSLKNNFAYEIQGNGHTISNLKFVYDKESNPLPQMAMFGEIKSTAIMKDITFDNLTLDYQWKGTAITKLYFVFTKINEGAQIENVKLNGTWKIEKYSDQNVSNLVGEVSAWTSCLFGDTYASDSAYLTATNNQGFTVNNGAALTSYITYINK